MDDRVIPGGGPADATDATDHIQDPAPGPVLALVLVPGGGGLIHVPAAEVLPEVRAGVPDTHPAGAAVGAEVRAEVGAEATAKVTVDHHTVKYTVPQHGETRTMGKQRLRPLSYSSSVKKGYYTLLF